MKLKRNALVTTLLSIIKIKIFLGTQIYETTKDIYKKKNQSIINKKIAYESVNDKKNVKEQQ